MLMIPRVPATSFLNNDRSRSAMKFTYGNKNYQFHRAHEGSNSTVRRRHVDTLALARGLEKRASELDKRQSGGSGSIELTDYCQSARLDRSHSYRSLMPGFRLQSLVATTRCITVQSQLVHPVNLSTSTLIPARQICGSRRRRRARTTPSLASPSRARLRRPRQSGTSNTVSDEERNPLLAAKAYT